MKADAAMERLRELVEQRRADVRRVDALEPRDYWYPSLSVVMFLDELEALLVPGGPAAE